MSKVLKRTDGANNVNGIFVIKIPSCNAIIKITKLSTSTESIDELINNGIFNLFFFRYIYVIVNLIAIYVKNINKASVICFHISARFISSPNHTKNRGINKPKDKDFILYEKLIVSENGIFAIKTPAINAPKILENPITSVK
jgi:hypothetical protein